MKVIICKQIYCNFAYSKQMNSKMSHQNSNQQIYSKLILQYPIFHFDTYTYHFSDSDLVMQFFFHTEELNFSPKIRVQFGDYLKNELSNHYLEGIIFNIGMIELISYWKCVASPLLFVHPFKLSQNEVDWWKKLYYKGLGEYFYQNKLDVSLDQFLDFTFSDQAPSSSQLSYPVMKPSNRVIVPIGGGKDSVVTLDHFQKTNDVIPFIMNPRGATIECANIAGFNSLNKIFIINRTIDPLLIKLNGIGYLNGHTPFSALLAFYTVLVGYITNTREIALSNESSANESTIPNTDINHQYSKSKEFEMDFQYYVRQYMNDCVHYFSYLRPYSELQIAQLFSKLTPYHSVFKSCNAGSKEDKWCCNCSKCLFAFIILSPFIEYSKLVDIFGQDLFEKEEMIPYFDELTGVAPNKPFECVGTIEEVNEALILVSKSNQDKLLIKRFLSVTK